MDTDSAVRPAVEALTLRVDESLTITPGRGIARLDPKDLAQLGADVGDVLAIAGRRLTVARAMPARLEHRGLGVVQIDEITRANAKAGLNERVQIARVPASPARRVGLRPMGGGAFAKRADGRALVRLLEALPVVVGDRVRVAPFASRILEFEVVETDPPEAVVVSGSTQVVFDGHAPAPDTRAGVAYRDVGGLHQEIRRLREIVELPLRCPRVFRHLGIAAPKGVLLHGPPGTGKTLLARAVAHETDVAFVSVTGPEIIQKFYGESEARLRGIFEQANKRAPCIVFIDEIDAIAPRREHLQGEVEKRVVAQLLALMDGLTPRRQVIVIGATNLPDAIDPALRRPGRFDREIEIGVPDAEARREILAVHTRQMPLAGDVALGELAAITHGFVGADLEALCREAAMTTLRAAMPDAAISRARIPEDRIASLRVEMAHFRSALTEVSPSAMRDVRVEVPDVPWEDVGGMAEVKQQLREAVEWPLGMPGLLRRAGVRPPRGVLLFGPPGTGKTLLARALASQSGINFLSVKGPSLLTKYVGESERGVRDLFRRARQSAPCVLVFDEIDALAPARGGGADDGHVAARVVAQLLTELDGIEDLEGVLVVGTTNRKDMVDPALLRPGRFDLLLEVPMPDLAARTAIFRVHLKGKPVSEDVDAAALAARMPGASGAAIAAVCRRGALTAIRRCIDQPGGPAADAEPQIAMRDLLAAIAELETTG
jgi:transitional endoplasmic reticulum ATPase